MTDPDLAELAYQELLNLASEYRPRADIAEVMALARDPDFTRALNAAYGLGQLLACGDPEEWVHRDDLEPVDEDGMRGEGYRAAVADVGDVLAGAPRFRARRAVEDWVERHSGED